MNRWRRSDGSINRILFLTFPFQYKHQNNDNDDDDDDDNNMKKYPQTFFTSNVHMISQEINIFFA